MAAGAVFFERIMLVQHRAPKLAKPNAPSSSSFRPQDLCLLGAMSSPFWLLRGHVSSTSVLVGERLQNGLHWHCHSMTVDTIRGRTTPNYTGGFATPNHSKQIFYGVRPIGHLPSVEILSCGCYDRMLSWKSSHLTFFRGIQRKMVVLIEEGKVTLDNLLAQAIAENRVPGAYFAAETADRTLYSGSAGVGSFHGPTSGKVDKNSVFWICSMMKLVVTFKVAIIQPIDEAGKITFETPVDSIVPELANPVVVDDINALEYTFKLAQNKMLIKHPLNHSSGLHYVPSHRKASPESLGPAYTAVGYGGDFSWRKFFELIQNGLPVVPLAFEPVLAVCSSKELYRKVSRNAEKIFGPIGMKTTSFYLTPELEKNIVNMTYRRKDGALEVWSGQLGIIERDPSKVGILLGGIGIYTKLDDYLLLFCYLLQVQGDDMRPFPPLEVSDT
ncbi:beta-lactamase/transpeptidase-like protein [Pholiota conissans]|uniref:Beta-lactamase/transpeptidase-like protein n=1 Tax=Pholiota conissans TaxID=109636 RepID=A0A9P5YWZ4_9AGAR|nr:beta-lactamase/transpeptidase-like protein [Pholiota conissans]